MANQNTPQQLYTLLSNPKADLAKAGEIITQNPNILQSKEFMQVAAIPALDNAGLQKTTLDNSMQKIQSIRQVMTNLQQLEQQQKAVPGSLTASVLNSNQTPNGETIGTQLIKNITTLRNQPQENVDPALAEQTTLYQNAMQSFLKQTYQSADENGYGADRTATNAAGQTPTALMEAAPRGSLSVEKSREELEAELYRGTISVEDAEKLKKMKENDVAEVGNHDGDNKKENRQPSNDKFKDEDVVKYMYEDWFLGGASWLFNKIEDYTLAVVDMAAEKYHARHERLERERKRAKNEHLKEGLAKLSDFTRATSEAITAKGDAYHAKSASFKDIMADLRANLNNPNPQWKHYSNDDEFVKTLRDLPDKGESFINACEQELENRTRMLEATDKIAMMTTALEMSDEMMRRDKPWLKEDKTYKETSTLLAEFNKRSGERHQSILEAVSVLSEDARLAAEIKYEQLKGDKPDFRQYVQQNVDAEVNGFLDSLNRQIQAVQKLQDSEISKQHLVTADGRSTRPDSGIRKGLREIDTFINTQIKKGAVYSEKLFAAEHSQDRIEDKTDLYKEALLESSPTSVTSSLTKMKALNGYQQDTLDARRVDLAGRRSQLEAFKNRLATRDRKIGTPTLKHGGRNE